MRGWRAQVEVGGGPRQRDCEIERQEDSFGRGGGQCVGFKRGWCTMWPECKLEVSRSAM